MKRIKLKTGKFTFDMRWLAVDRSLNLSFGSTYEQKERNRILREEGVYIVSPQQHALIKSHLEFMMQIAASRLSQYNRGMQNAILGL